MKGEMFYVFSYKAIFNVVFGQKNKLPMGESSN